MSNQKLSWGIFLAGLAVFLVAIGHDLASHSTWTDVATPKSVGELLAEIGSAGVAMAGALGITLKS